jgi:hypothetical protein
LQTSTLEVVTPVMAREYLSKNKKNRPLSQFTVDRYAADMKAGLWETTSQAIGFDEDGDLQDGQHRLAAVIQSDIPLTTWVIRGLSKKAFVVLDNGKQRTLGDVLAIEGHSHSNTIAAIARGAFSHIAGLSYRYNPRRTLIEPFIAKHPYVAEVGQMVGGGGYRFPRGTVGAVLFLANEQRHMDDEVKAFVHGVYSGEGLSRGDPRLTLREWLISGRMSKSPPRADVQFAAVVRCWNAFSTGKELLVIKQTEDQSIRTLPIFGFSRSNYPDVPDLYEANLEASRHQPRSVARGEHRAHGPDQPRPRPAR